VEWWVKWSQPITGDAPGMDGPGVEFVEVAKRRRAWFEGGLLREVTEVRFGGAPGAWRGWTVGLEGPPPLPHLEDLERAVAELLGLPGVAAMLTPKRSASYPEWLSRL
jgi:hypothetical protein